MNTPSLNKKKEHIGTMFDDIASNYDRLNHLLSFNIDKYWRKKLVASVQQVQPKKVLDIATGTGDVAFKISQKHPCQITAVDISVNMLEVAKTKAKEAFPNGSIQFIEAEAAHLPFEDNSFDCITVAFGIRNFEDLEKGLIEMNRVLKPGGKLCILEFSKPKPPFSYFYSLYSYTILPIAGKLFAKNARAYVYLQQSAAIFPHRQSLLNILNRCGYKNASYSALT